MRPQVAHEIDDTMKHGPTRGTSSFAILFSPANDKTPCNNVKPGDDNKPYMDAKLGFETKASQLQS